MIPFQILVYQLQRMSFQAKVQPSAGPGQARFLLDFPQEPLARTRTLQLNEALVQRRVVVHIGRGLSPLPKVLPLPSIHLQLLQRLSYRDLEPAPCHSAHLF